MTLRDTLRRTPILLGWRWLNAAIGAWRDRGRFAGVTTYCLFVGHGRSGHSIVGAMLDAHPDIVLSDELDALQYVELGFTRDQVFSLSDQVAAHQARSLRRKSGRGGQTYSYHVPGQWQGRTVRPQVVGDSRAATTVKRLARSPSLLGRLRARMPGIQLRFVQVVRNPFDTIATMMLRTGRSFESAFAEYFSNWDAVDALKRRLRAEEFLVVGHEALLEDPRTELRRICAFLGVRCEDEYLEACAAILYPTPSRSRDLFQWTPEQRAMVAGRLDGIADLRGYSFDA